MKRKLLLTTLLLSGITINTTYSENQEHLSDPKQQIVDRAKKLNAKDWSNTRETFAKITAANAGSVITGQLCATMVDSLQDAGIKEVIFQGGLQAFFAASITNLFYQVLVSADLIKNNKNTMVYDTLKDVVSLKIDQLSDPSSTPTMLTNINTITDEIALSSKKSGIDFSNIYILHSLIDLKMRTTLKENAPINDEIKKCLKKVYSAIELSIPDNLVSLLTIKKKKAKKILLTSDNRKNIKNALRNFAKLQLLAKLAGINKLNAATCKLVSEYKLPAGEIATEAININNELAKIIPEILSFSDKAKNIAENAKVALDTMKESLFNYTNIFINMAFSWLSNRKKKETLQDLGNKYVNSTLVHQGITYSVSSAAAVIPVVGAFASIVPYIVDQFITDNLQSTNAVKAMLDKFQCVDIELKSTLKYLFNGLIKELNTLNGLYRGLLNTTSPNGKNILHNIIADTSKILNEISTHQTLKNLTPIEVSNLLIETPQEKGDESSTVLNAIILANLTDKQKKFKEKYYKYYKTFMKVYFAFTELFSTYKILEDFYTKSQNLAQGKDAYIYKSSDDPYDKVLKMICKYINTGNFNIKDDATTCVKNLKDYLSRNKDKELITKQLMETLSLCICYNEKNNGWMVNFGRNFHINREKRGLTGIKDKMAKAVNKISKGFTGAKFKIFTTKMLEAVSAKGGLHLDFPEPDANKITGLLKKYRQIKKIQTDYNNKKL